jgi:tRNA (guanine37-N1)-methyltransferase
MDLVCSGDNVVAVAELRRVTKKSTREIVEKIRRHNKNVKSVVVRGSGTKGDFRLRKQKIVWGAKNTEVVHQEYGYRLKLDPRFVYFSPRESTIRQYVFEKVRPKENVLLMFAGVGPYAIGMARKQPKVGQIVAVEFNPKAAEYMRENIILNRVSDKVVAIEGDVSDVCEDLAEKFNRIVMPMIKAGDFLQIAAKCAKRTGTIHVYLTTNEREKGRDWKKLVTREMKRAGKRYQIKDVRRISLYAPHKWKILVEIKLK